MVPESFHYTGVYFALNLKKKGIKSLFFLCYENGKDEITRTVED